MNLVTHDITSPVENHMHTHCVEASTLGLPVGYFPQTIKTDMGNGLDFIFERRAVGPNMGGYAEVIHVYRQEFGILRLHVIND